MDETKGLRFFQDNVKELRHHHQDCWIGICPACGEKELRIFISGMWPDSPIEVRCGKCSLWAFGIEEFTRKAEEMNFSIRRIPVCKVCGDPLKISPYVRRTKEYCSQRCRKRAQRARERCHDLTV